MEQDKIQTTQKQVQPEPLTLAEIHEANHKRTSLIKKEFIEGFEFLKKYPTSVTFFGSARFGEGNEYYEKARKIAKRIVTEIGYAVVSGGGPGIMEAGNRGAREMGGNSVGLNIHLPREQTTNPYITDHIDFHYFFVRKVCLSYSAEAYLFFPGGFGTMDEFFELITMVQTHKIPKAPIVLVGSEFWNQVKEFMIRTLLSRGTIDAQDLHLFTITDDEDEILKIIKNAPVRNGVRYNKNSDSK